MNNTPREEIHAYLKKLNTQKVDAFMHESREEGNRYLLHNEDRFIEAIEILDRLIPTFKGKLKLLDIGTSPFTFILKKRYPQIDIYTIDYSNNFASMAKRENITFRQFDLSGRKDLFPHKKFHIVTFLETLEHLPKNWGYAIKNIEKHMEKYGYCILQTPNKYAFKSIVLALITQNRWNSISTVPEKSHEFTHFREFSMQELMKMIKKIPTLEIQKAEYSLYYDTVSSSLVYRKDKRFMKLPLSLHYQFVRIVPPLRKGLNIIMRKIS